VITHGPKFREPQHINWKHNFKIIMHAVEETEYGGIFCCYREELQIELV
jgi:hypothetical protein